jgi:plastocyanin
MKGALRGWPGTAIAAALAMAAGLGGMQLARATEEAPRDAQPPGPVRVALDEYTIAVEPGVVAAGQVRLLVENVGKRRHNLVVLVDGAEIESPYLRPGDSVVWDVPIRAAGAYRYWCAEYRHLEKGMEGTLAVE